VTIEDMQWSKEVGQMRQANSHRADALARMQRGCACMYHGWQKFGELNNSTLWNK